MKLHYTKILVFSFSLNILMLSSYAHNKNKIYIKSHTPTTTSRVLSECDLYMSSYDNDPDMKSVKENFDRQTSQRFEEYEKRMSEKRLKCKEQCDKDIQKIILKDKIEKSFAEKVEKGCLKCGCGLGAVAPVWGLVSGLWYATWSQYVSAKIFEESIKKGLEVGLAQIMNLTRSLHPGADLPNIAVTQMLSSGNFSNNVTLFDMAKHINDVMYNTLDNAGYNAFCNVISSMAKRSVNSFNVTYRTYSEAVTQAVTQGKSNAINTLTPTTNALTTAIIASIVAIVVIVLVMIIIYLILRYRRKKKMKKKQQYTKLLKE
ncbi:rifin [Plasmodium sp. gorilla clade G1]|nr:rifin [Plasmodium sp. gorilla clade G1]